MTKLILEYKEIKMIIVIKIFLTIISLALFLVFWFFLVIAQAQNILFELDSNYYMFNWPGPLAKVEMVNNQTEYVDALSDHIPVDAFAVLDNYIVGRNVEGRWFAINRKTHQVWYPYSSAEKLQSATGIVFSQSELTTSYPESRRVIYKGEKIKAIVYSIIFIISLVVIWWFERIKKLLKILFIKMRFITS